MDDHYDVIVVGGGPGGSSVATVLSQRGLRVALLERDHCPRDKVCGDGVPFPAIGVVERLGAFDEIPKKGYRIEGITVSSPNGRQFKTHTPKWIDGSTGYIVPRSQFDEILFRNAVRCGAHGIENFCVETVSKDSSEIWHVVSEDQQSLTADFLIGADGAHSTVARSLGIFRNDYKHEMFAIRGYFEDVSGLERNIELHFTTKSLPGYLWIFPTGERSANVGFITTWRELQKRGGNLRELLREAVENHEPVGQKFSGAKAVSAIRGWPLPLGSKVGPCVDNSALLVGDAARLIDPATGEGIYYALRSGEIAAQVTCEALSKKRVNKDALAIYRRRLLDEFGESFRWGYLLQRLLVSPSVANLLVQRAIKNEFVAEYIGSVICHSKPKRALFSPAFLASAIIPSRVFPRRKKIPERRKYPRYPYLLDISSGNHTLLASDISMGGIQLDCTSLPQEKLLTVALKIRNDRTPLMMGGEIIWSKRVPETSGQYKLGVRFQNIDSKQESSLLHHICRISEKLSISANS